jgi:hypothetical protein
MDNGLFNRLHAAAFRSICAGSIAVVGRDGRQRIVMESLDADGDLATILREISGDLPQHSPTCAAVKSSIRVCDCIVSAHVNAIADGSLRSAL